MAEWLGREAEKDMQAPPAKFCRFDSHFCQEPETACLPGGVGVTTNLRSPLSSTKKEWDWVFAILGSAKWCLH